jgi:phosphotriesterase-related protein
MSFVRTIMGDIDPALMGVTYSHEHIVIDESYPVLQNPDFILNDTKKIAEELNEVYAAGGRTMVDTMPADCGRNILKLAEVSRLSGIQIIAPTGIHLPVYYPPHHWQYYLPEEQLTQLFVDDVEIGIDRYDYNSPVVERSSHRAGMIKLASGDDPFDDNLKKIFRAVVATHKKTGVPILTHTNGGRHAVAQAELFHLLGADLRHVVISHVDRCNDWGYHQALMQTGVRVEYDSAFSMERRTMKISLSCSWKNCYLIIPIRLWLGWMLPVIPIGSRTAANPVLFICSLILLMNYTKEAWQNFRKIFL